MGKKARVRNGGREPVQQTHHFKNTLFDEWRLKNGETVRVSIDNYRGHDLVHVRRWQRGPTGQLYPTRREEGDEEIR